MHERYQFEKNPFFTLQNATYELNGFEFVIFRVHHLSFEGEDGRISARIFFSHSSGEGNFLGLCMHFFYSHSCCIIFFTVKALWELVFLKSSTPPSKIKWSTPYNLLFLM